MALVWQLLLAGQTPANLIPNAVRALHDHPEQLAKLKADDSLMPRAVEELIRWCGPTLLMIPRYAAEDVELFGTLVRQGEAVTAVVASANRDPRAYTAPDELDLTRHAPARATSASATAPTSASVPHSPRSRPRWPSRPCWPATPASPSPTRPAPPTPAPGAWPRSAPPSERGSNARTRCPSVRWGSAEVPVASRPPSTRTVSPVIQAAASEARKATSAGHVLRRARAASSGTAARPAPRGRVQGVGELGLHHGRARRR